MSHGYFDQILVDGEVDAAIEDIAKAAERTQLAEACSWFWGNRVIQKYLQTLLRNIFPQQSL